MKYGVIQVKPSINVHSGAKLNGTWTGLMQKSKLVINAKKAAFFEYMQNLSEKTLTSYRKARNLAKATARHFSNDYWSTSSKSIQKESYCGNFAAMYERIKKAIGPQISQSVPTRSSFRKTLKDRGKQMQR